MNNVKLLCFGACFVFLNGYAQVDSTQKIEMSAPLAETNTSKEKKEIYKLCPAADIPIVAVGAGWSIYAFTKIYSKKASSEAEILNLDKNDIPKIDRWAAGKSDPAADANSDILFYGSIPVALTLLLDKDIRHDGWKYTFMYLEAMSITGMLYTGSVYFVDRYRPETYNTKLPVEKRMGGNYKDAFFAGHPALVATSLFFTAKVYGDYHPGSGLSYGLYGLAIAGTGATVYMRHIAGKHFPSDLFIGTAVGTLSGILVPQFHKQKSKDSNFGLVPYFDGTSSGIYMTFRY